MFTRYVFSIKSHRATMAALSAKEEVRILAKRARAEAEEAEQEAARQAQEEAAVRAQAGKAEVEARKDGDLGRADLLAIIEAQQAQIDHLTLLIEGKASL